MHRTSRQPLALASLASSVAFAVACGSPPAPAAPVTPAPAPAPVATTPPPPDLSPAPEPEGLIAFARAAKPNQALKVLGGWVQMPVPGPAEVGSLVTGEATANLIDLDQPIDFALVMRGRQPRGAISAAVKSLDEARLTFSKYKLVPIENGAFRVEGLGKPDDADKDGDEAEARVCEIVPAFGPAETRLVCADSEATLKDLAPWLARTAPRATYPSDLHVELRFAPVRPLVSQMRRVLPMLVGSALGVHRSGVPEVDDAFRATIDDLVDFTSDAEVASLDAMLAEPQGTVTLSSQYRSTTSFLARVAVAHPERAAAPPASFWKLPADSDFAFFHGGIDAADFEHPRDHIADVIGAGLAKGGLADVDRKAIRDAASHTLDLLAVRSEYAKGLDIDAADKAIFALKAVKPTDKAAHDEAERVAAEKMAGWFVIGLDAPAPRVVALEKEWAAAWARPGVAKWARAKAAEAPAPPVIRLAALPKGVTGKDAAHLEMVVYPSRPEANEPDDKGSKKKATKVGPGKPLILHALVVPDGNASWVVIAADEALAVEKAKDLVATGTSALGSRPGLSSMKDAKMNAGGFFSARGFAVGDVFAWTLATPWRKLGRDPLAGISSAPDQAMTPVPFQLVSQPGAGESPAGTFTATFTLPKAAIESLVRRLMH